MIGEDSIPGQLEEIRQDIAHGDAMREKFALEIKAMSAELKAGDLRMRFIESGLAENTAMTRELAKTMEDAAGKLNDAAETLKDIRDYQIAGRVVKKGIVWVGGVGGGVAGLWSAWQAFLKH